MELLHSRTVVSVQAQQGTCSHAAHRACDHSITHFELAEEIHLPCQMLQSRIKGNPTSNVFL